MTAAHPNTVARAIVEMFTEDAKPLLETYRWAYSIAHGASGGGDGVRSKRQYCRFVQDFAAKDGGTASWYRRGGVLPPHWGILAVWRS